VLFLATLFMTCWQHCLWGRISTVRFAGIWCDMYCAHHGHAGCKGTVCMVAGRNSSYLLL